MSKNNKTFHQPDLFDAQHKTRNDESQPLTLTLVAERGTQVEQFVGLLKSIGLARAYRLCQSYDIRGIRGEEQYLVDNKRGSRKDYYKHEKENGEDFFIYTNISRQNKQQYLNRLYGAMMNEYKQVQLPLVFDTKQEPDKSKTPSDKKKSPPTNLSVEFPDGTIIVGKTAKEGFVRALAYIGFEHVVALKILMCGEQLVSHNPNDHTKKSEPVVTDDGWSVVTHSSTKEKIAKLKFIAQRVGVKITTELF